MVIVVGPGEALALVGVGKQVMEGPRMVVVAVLHTAVLQSSSHFP